MHAIEAFPLTLLEAVLVGAGLGFGLALPPGPVMAKMVFDVARHKTLLGALVGLGASTADAAFFCLIAFGFLRVLPDARALGVLALFGVALMDFFAYAAWRSARTPLAPSSGRLEGFGAGFALAATSPFNLAFWLTSGAPFLARYGPAIGLGFFPALLVSIVASLAVFRFAARRVARFETYVAYVSAVLLFGFGLLLATEAFRLLVVG